MSPLLSFKSDMAPLVEEGTKRQTIRAYRKDGRNPREGQTLYLYKRARQPDMSKMAETVCTSASPIEIDLDGFIWSDQSQFEEHGRRDLHLLDIEERERLAKADGFEDAEAMIAWFTEVHGLPFRGLVIRW